jgi:hypothetical protein
LLEGKLTYELAVIDPLVTLYLGLILKAFYDLLLDNCNKLPFTYTSVVKTNVALKALRNDYWNMFGCVGTE